MKSRRMRFGGALALLTLAGCSSPTDPGADEVKGVRICIGMPLGTPCLQETSWRVGDIRMLSGTVEIGNGLTTAEREGVFVADWTFSDPALITLFGETTLVKLITFVASGDLRITLTIRTNAGAVHVAEMDIEILPPLGSGAPGAHVSGNSRVR